MDDYDIDVVIPFVDCDDHEWQKEYNNWFSVSYNPVRFRSWDTIKYVLRGIEKNMSWAHNVFLVVMSGTQVPSYVNTNKVRIVYHKDYMPTEFIPCFNSNPIEMYMWNIPDLSEHFILFNDDVIPLCPMSPDDFFKDENTIRCTHYYNKESDLPRPLTVFQDIKKISTDLAFKACGLKNKQNIILSQRHSAQGYIKSQCEQCFKTIESDILEHLGRMRSSNDINHYIYTNYMLLQHRTDLGEKPTSLSYFRFGKYTIGDLIKMCKEPLSNLICINDTVDVSPDQYKTYKNSVCELFDEIYPIPSVYEL